MSYEPKMKKKVGSNVEFVMHIGNVSCIPLLFPAKVLYSFFWWKFGIIVNVFASNKITIAETNTKTFHAISFRQLKMKSEKLFSKVGVKNRWELCFYHVLSETYVRKL